MHRRDSYAFPSAVLSEDCYSWVIDLFSLSAFMHRRKHDIARMYERKALQRNRWMNRTTWDVWHSATRKENKVKQLVSRHPTREGERKKEKYTRALHGDLQPDLFVYWNTCLRQRMNRSIFASHTRKINTSLFRRLESVTISNDIFHCILLTFDKKTNERRCHARDITSVGNGWGSR